MDENQANQENDTTDASSQNVSEAPLESFSENNGQDFDSKSTDELFGDNQQLNVILDIPVTISMELGRTTISVRNLLQLQQGSVIELDRMAGEPLDILVNGTLIAQGEVVVVNETFGIRITDVISPADRIKKLN